jgi:hypothetical protein
VGISRRAKDMGEREQMWWMYFVFMYENRIIISTEIVLRRKQG